MALTAQNDEFYSGDKRTLTFTVKDGAGAVVDITGRRSSGPVAARS